MGMGYSYPISCRKQYNTCASNEEKDFMASTEVLVCVQGQTDNSWGPRAIG
ncbi:unnamed protein product [Staurois parvus]|uniref:Uncharacterized protein n=1 Tax=Staurois parvus TaxID=386267 RepID=A0ABN9EJZ0_9NEOB|nr:unnamed protein product [Staurois parvus]